MKILIIRRDNIGDLILATPLLHALREKMPEAQIDVLTNSYSAPVLRGNPDVDHVYAYHKAHHRRSDQTWFGVHFHRICLLLRLRRERYDCIVLAKPQIEPRPLRLARWIGAKEILAVMLPSDKSSRLVTTPIIWTPEKGGHIVERSFQLAEHFGVTGTPGPLHLYPDPTEVRLARERLAPILKPGRPIIVVNLSARKVLQRWSAENFIELIRKAHSLHGHAFMLIWSPGTAKNPRHPGDDEKAGIVAKGLTDIPCVAFATNTLEELIAGVSLADGMMTSDGGAMHFGAALGKPTLCFFGNSEPARWRPWGVPHIVLQSTLANLDVSGISVDQAAAAYTELFPPLVGADSIQSPE